MKKIYFLLMCLLAIGVMPMVGGTKKKVHTIGDSTMANYATDGSTDKRGWAQMLQQFFNTDNVTVNNRGKSGASSKSFYKEAAYWPTLVKGGSDEMKAGDYLLIQFAHNDEKTTGTDGDSLIAYYNSIGDATTAATVDYRGTTAFDTFKKFMRSYINEAKSMGVTPIVVGPICRKYFSGNDITRTGRHDLGDKFNLLKDGKLLTGQSVPASDNTYDYVESAKAVAAEYDDVPFIDLTTLTANMYIKYGESYCTNNLFCVGDGTHVNALGATLIAREFAQQLKNQASSETDAKKKAVLEGLAEDVIVSNDISFNPTSGDLGEAYVGMSITKEYNVSAFGLAAATGTFTISTTDGFKVSLDKQTWGNSITVDYDNSSLISTIYVKSTIEAQGEKTGTLTATDGTNTKTLDLKITGISLVGGEETSCVWPLNSTSVTATSELLTATDATVSGMTITSNLASPTSPEGHGKMLLFTIDGGTWPANEIDEVSTRYIQFQATVPSDKTFNMDKISLDLCGWGGNSVCYHAYYATKPDFSDQVLIGEGLKMTAKSAISISSDIVKKLEEGESIYIRVYPWLNVSSAATGKYIALSDVTIHGTMSEAGGEVVTVNGAQITWPLGSESTDKVNYSDERIGAGVQVTTFAMGSEVSSQAAQKWSGTDGITPAMLRFGNGSATAWSNSSYQETKSINFTITPQTGFTFIPTKVSFKACRFGTNGGTIDVQLTGDKTITVAQAQAPNRSGASTTLKTFEYDVDGVAGTEDKPLTLSLGLNGLGAGKYLGFADVVIEGTLSGTVTETTKYYLTTNVSPQGAGTITIDPQLASYKDGKEVTLTATKNFGYKFSHWEEDGQTVSTKATKTITMDKDRTITAVFDEVPVYTVTAKATNDLEKALGSVTITPNDHSGQYEEGEIITATADESKILKFAGWTDEFMNNTVTTASRQLTVAQDMELVANFEVQDFVAVFDASANQAYAYETTASYPFSADITWDDNRDAKCSVVKVCDGSLVYSQSTGTPVVRNRIGVVLSGINGLYQNGYRTSDIAWQYEFSTKGFNSATFVADMAAKNMAHKSYKAQYSLDGKTFTDISGATWDMTANVIKSLEIQFPAECADQNKVYFRITGTGTEQLSTSYSVEGQFGGLDWYSHSESGVGNVFVLGEAQAQDDGKNPEVTSTSPANGATGVSASGTISVSYSERIQKSNSNGVITLTGNNTTKTIEPTFSSKSIAFQYANLAYGETYTVKIPAGYVEDKSGNAADACEFSFTVMNRVKPAARTFDAIVDASLKQLNQKDGKIPATDEMPAQFRTIQAAIDAAPTDGSKPYLIYIKNGEYRDPNFTFNAGYGTAYTDLTPSSTATETLRIAGGINEYDSCRIVYINKPNIHLIGQDRDKVIISTDRFDGSCSDHSRVWYHISAGATVEVQAGGTDFHMENLTVDNENWTKKKMAGPQALCFNVSGDRAVLNNIRTRSYQDTYYNGSTRTFINNSEIHGAVDFIYGNGDVWFENCKLNINRSSGGFIVAPSHPENTAWGYVFNNTRITTDEVSDPSKYSIWLGRPWHGNPKTVFLHTTMELTPCDSLWYETMGGLPAVWAVYDFHNVNGYAFTGAKNASRSHYYYTDGNGNKVWGVSKNTLTDEEAASYTLSNVLAGDGTTTASGYWDPTPIVEKTSKPQVTVNGNVAEWAKDEYAVCYVVTVNGEAKAFPTDARYIGNEGDEVTVQSVNEYGALSDASEAVTLGAATAVIGVERDDSLSPEGERAGERGRLYGIDGKKLSKPLNHGVTIQNGKKVVKK